MNGKSLYDEFIYVVFNIMHKNATTLCFCIHLAIANISINSQETRIMGKGKQLAWHKYGNARGIVQGL